MTETINGLTFMDILNASESNEFTILLDPTEDIPDCNSSQPFIIHYCQDDDHYYVFGLERDTDKCFLTYDEALDYIISEIRAID